MSRNRARDLALAGRYKKIADSDACTYCGVRASSFDHVLPITIAARLGHIKELEHLKILVPACREGNNLAAGLLFKSLAAKRRYIKGRLRKRYKKLLATPTWNEVDIVFLGHTLRTAIERAMQGKADILARLNW